MSVQEKTELNPKVLIHLFSTLSVLIDMFVVPQILCLVIPAADLSQDSLCYTVSLDMAVDRGTQMGPSGGRDGPVPCSSKDKCVGTAIAPRHGAAEKVNMGKGVPRC